MTVLIVIYYQECYYQGIITTTECQTNFLWL